MSSETLEPQKFNKDREERSRFESDVDRMLYEIYGRHAVEDFQELWETTPGLSLEEALARYEESPTSQQTNYFRTRNLKVVAQELMPALEKEAGKPVEMLDVGKWDNIIISWATSRCGKHCSSRTLTAKDESGPPYSSSFELRNSRILTLFESFEKVKMR